MQNYTTNIIKKQVTPIHEDARRSLSEPYNGTFIAKQIKLLKVKEKSVLGNHFHPFGQFFFFMKGGGYYTFIDVITKEKKNYTAKKGDYIQIEKNIAHAGLLRKGTIIIEGNEEKYTGPECDIKYEVMDE